MENITTTKANGKAEGLMAKSSRSRVMESLLKRNNTNWNEFITTIWEEKCMYFPVSTTSASTNDDDKAYVDDAIITSKTKLASNKTKEDDNNPILEEIKNNGWNVLIGLMDGDGNDVDNDDDSNSNSDTDRHSPLIFQNLQPLPSKNIYELYDNNLYSAYLAGSSLVWNHVDTQSSFIAKLCQDLQGERIGEDYVGSSTDDLDNTRNNKCGCFPHVYANAYLTPPQSQTVPPHADDRDVFIFQICGRKNWNVYSNIPIKHPYTKEQVGKDDLDVPLDVLDGPLAFNDYLNEGDVLYIPRGMVHEAKTTTNDFSFHITIAIATHDWTIGGTIMESLIKRMTSQDGVCRMTVTDRAIIHNKLRTIPTFRKSIVPTTTTTTTANNTTAATGTGTATSTTSDMTTTTGTEMNVVGGSTVDITKIQNQIDKYNHIFNNTNNNMDFDYFQFKTIITAHIIVNDIKTKIDTHNIRSEEQRNKLLLLHSSSKAKSTTNNRKQQSTTSNNNNVVVVDKNSMDEIIGPYAAKNNISLDTLIRSSTIIEREYATSSLSSSSSSSRRGLNVRDEIGDEINTIISQIKKITTDRGAIKVKDFNKYLHNNDVSSSLVCNLTLLCLAKRAVELGAFAIATTTTTTTTKIETDDNNNDSDKTSTTTNKTKRKDDHGSNEEVTSSSKQQKT